MPNYIEYFLNTRSDVAQFECITISHPDFTKEYNVVRNFVGDLTVTLENAEQQTFEYYPIDVKPLSSRDDLDQTLQINFGDLGELLPKEVDAVASSDGFSTKPTIIYRSYRSDYLSAPLVGPTQLEINNLVFSEKGATFEAKAPSLNVSRTGEIYSYDRFSMLRGFL